MLHYTIKISFISLYLFLLMKIYYQIINQTTYRNNTTNHVFPIDYVPNYYYLGTHLREISYSLCPCTGQMISENFYSLFDYQTYRKFGLNMEYNIFLVNNASAYGKIEFLKKWKKKSWNLKYSTDTMDLASQNGHLNILEWWKNSGYKLKYSSYAIDWACEYGHLDILQWWFRSGLRMKYSSNAIKMAFLNRHHHIISWWQQYQTSYIIPLNFFNCRQIIISSVKKLWNSTTHFSWKQIIFVTLVLLVILFFV